MTDTTERTYVGDLPRGSVALPARTVPFTAGATIEFTVDEAEMLDPEEWAGGERQGIPVPADRTATLDTEADFAAGTPAEVIARAKADPTIAYQALAQERAGKNRKTVVGQLIELIGSDPAEQATTQED